MISWTRMQCSMRCRQCERDPALRVNSNGKLCRKKRHSKIARQLIRALTAGYR